MDVLVIGGALILWGIACVLFRVPIARFSKRFNDSYYRGFLQPPDVPPEIVAVAGVLFAGTGIVMLVMTLITLAA